MRQCRARAPLQKSQHLETYSVDNEQSVGLTCYSCCHRFYAERSGKNACARVAGYIMAETNVPATPFPISGSVSRTAAKKPYHAARTNWRTRVRSSTAVNGFGRTASGFCIAMLCAAMLSVDSDI